MTVINKARIDLVSNIRILLILIIIKEFFNNRETIATINYEIQ